MEQYDSAQLYLSNIQIPEVGHINPFILQEPSAKESLAIR